METPRQTRLLDFITFLNEYSEKDITLAESTTLISQEQSSPWVILPAGTIIRLDGVGRFGSINNPSNHYLIRLKNGVIITLPWNCFPEDGLLIEE